MTSRTDTSATQQSDKRRYVQSVARLNNNLIISSLNNISLTAQRYYKANSRRTRCCYRRESMSPKNGKRYSFVGNTNRKLIATNIQCEAVPLTGRAVLRWSYNNKRLYYYDILSHIITKFFTTFVNAAELRLSKLLSYVNVCVCVCVLSLIHI